MTRHRGTRALARSALTLGTMALSCALVPVATGHALYATAVLLVVCAAGCAVAVASRDVHHATLPRLVEYRAVRATDRDAQRLRALLDHAPVPLLVLGVDGALHAANRAARRLFATEDRLIDPPPGLTDALANLRPGERRTLRLAPAGESMGTGAQRSFAVTVAQAGVQPGLSALIALTDIEAEINASEAQALREVLQVLSHEIMNSLTPVVSLAQSVHEMLDDAAPDDPAILVEARKAIGVILRRARGLDRFVHGYRTLARLPPPQPRVVRLAELIDQSATLFRTRWGGRVDLDVVGCDHAARARLDPDLLEQALICLLTNAAEAAMCGAAALGGARPAVGLSVAIGDARDDGRIAIRVADNGDGVPPDHRETVFRAFFSLKDNGDGIGLSLARQIAADHGGSLNLAPAAPGEGAVFVLRL